jgi:hypothetical protein
MPFDPDPDVGELRTLERVGEGLKPGLGGRVEHRRSGREREAKVDSALLLLLLSGGRGPLCALLRSAALAGIARGRLRPRRGGPGQRETARGGDPRLAGRSRFTVFGLFGAVAGEGADEVVRSRRGLFLRVSGIGSHGHGSDEQCESKLAHNAS